MTVPSAYVLSCVQLFATLWWHQPIRLLFPWDSRPTIIDQKVDGSLIPGTLCPFQNIWNSPPIHYRAVCGSVARAGSASNAGDLGSIPESGRSPGEGNGHPLQYSCLENPMNRDPWQATVHRATKNRAQLIN